MAFSQQSHIFYNNTQNNADADEEYHGISEPDFRSNTMLEDQYTKFQKRNHYLRKSVVMVDSNYRDINDKVISQPIIYRRLGIIFSSSSPTIMILYHPNNSLHKGDRILFNSIAFYPDQKMINGVSLSKFIYNTASAEPIFNIYPISNVDIFNYISWDSLAMIVSNEYNSKQLLIESYRSNFYYLNYTNQTITINNFITVDTNGNIKMSLVTNKTLGDPTTSYFKINFSKTLFNIYKLKLLDIKLPDKIFNINNVSFTTNGFKYRQNGKIRFILENNNFIVSNVDYVGKRINYDFYNIAENTSKNTYLARDIYSILTDVLLKLKSMPEFMQISQQYMFEIAYYFYIQYVLYYNKTGSKLETFSLHDYKDPTTNNSLYYVYTLDLINNALLNKKSPFILKPYDTLNNKMPLMYFNDYILYVNNDTYRLQTMTMNWFDRIYILDNPPDKTHFPVVLIKINNITTQMGIIQNTQEISSTTVSLNIATPSATSAEYQTQIIYKIGLSLIIQSFQPDDYLNIPIYTIISTNPVSSITIIQNKSIVYSGINGQYYYLDVGYSSTNITAFVSNMFKCDYTIYRAITQLIVDKNTTFVKNAIITYRVGITLTNNTLPNSYVGANIFGPNNKMNRVESYNGFDNSLSLYLYTVSYTINETSKYMIDMLLPTDIITSDLLRTIIIGKVVATYEPIGTIKDVRFSLISESIILTGNPPIKLPIDRIRIAKTTNASNQYIIDYTAEPQNILTLTRENTIISTTQTTDTFISSNTFTFVVNSPIVFSGNVFGGVVSGKTYYILNVISNTSFTISDTINGIRFPLSTMAGNMTCIISYPLKITSQPILDEISKLIVFNVSLTTNQLTIPDIYLSGNYNAYYNTLQIGICYSFYYKPIYNSMIIEKYDTFQIEYLNNIGEYLYTENNENNMSTLPNRNYIYKLPIKTNMQNLETYNLYPEYEVTIPNGDYNDADFAKTLETALNSVQIQKYNYFKKELEVPIMLNEKLNDPEYSESRFKVSYDSIQQSIDITSYTVDNKLQYVAIYNPIHPYLYIKLKNTDIDNNQRVYIEVLNNNAKSNITNNLVPLLNKEVTSRILPVFRYQLRILYPLPTNAYMGTVEPDFVQSYTDFTALISKIRLDPYGLITSQPGLTSSMKNLGQILVNQYKNNNSYIPESGVINNNLGIPSSIAEDELCIVINNIYYAYESYKFGRVTDNIDKTSNSQGNYRVNIQLIGDTGVSHPMFIGDIIYCLQSKTIAMIVPYEWGMFMDNPFIAKMHSTIPSPDIIAMGYKNYLKLLYKNTNKYFLMEYINKYNMMSYTEYNIMTQDFIQRTSNNVNYNSKYFIPMFDWPIQEAKNCFNGFEIPLDFPVSFIITEKDISLQFLTLNSCCLFIGPNSDGISDTPINILGFDASNVFSLGDYKNNSTQIPWKTTFDNNREICNTDISYMTITYSSDNVMRSNMLLTVDNIENYSIGDKVYIRDLAINDVHRRNLLNIYNTDVNSINTLMSFEIYLNYIVYRLALIQLGIPTPNGPIDFLRFDGASIEMMTSVTDSLYGTSAQIVAFSNFIIETHGAAINSNNLDASQVNITDNMSTSTTSNNICIVVANIINKVVLNKIIPWFIQPVNILSWTQGDRRLYLEIYDKYIDLSGKTILRIECQVLNRFVFVENINVFDRMGNKIGTVLATSIIPDSTLNNGDRYTIYINTFGLNTSNIISDSFILTVDKKYANVVATTPFYITDLNKHIYLYDTYLRFKTILQLNANNDNTIQKVFNFNTPDSIENIFSNLFNIENQNINSIKNGYFVSIAPNEVLHSNQNQLNGFYRVMTSLLDYKNLLHLCNIELGLLTDISVIQSDIINKTLGDKNIKQITQILDIYQLLADLTPFSTIMVDLNWSIKIEKNILQTAQYSIRHMDALIQICGSRNYMLEQYFYKDINITYVTNIPSNLNTLYSTLLSDETINKAVLSNDIGSLCKYSTFKTTNLDSTNLLLARPTDMLYCLQWLNSSANTNVCYVILPTYSRTINTFNRNNLTNYVVYLNWVFIDDRKMTNLNDVEYYSRIQSNIIIECVPVIESAYGYIPVYTKNPLTGEITYTLKDAYYIWKMTFKFPLKYPILRGTPILIKDYYTTLYKEPNSLIRGKNNIFIEQNWIDNTQMKLDINYVIKINYGSYNPIYINYINAADTKHMVSLDIDDNIHEETNIITSISSTPIIIDGKKYINIGLLRPVKYEFMSGLPIIIMTQPTNTASTYISASIPPYEVIDNTMYNINSIACNCLSTQNIIVNGEWYTKIFYQGESSMDLYGISQEGLKAYPTSTSINISISGMKGHVMPNVGFQVLERNNYNSPLVDIEIDQHNIYIKPVPDGIYKLESVVKEDNMNFMEHVLYNLPVQGHYEPMYTTSTPEQSDEWIDNQMNYRWIYCTASMDITTKTGYIDLFTYTNVSQPTPYNTKMDYLSTFMYAESTTYTYNTKPVYKVYMRLNVSNNASHFMTSLRTTRETDIDMNVVLTDQNITFQITPIYYFRDPSMFGSKPQNNIVYNFIVIKGRYQGIGGHLSCENPNDVLNNIEYTIKGIDTKRSMILLDLDNNPNIYISFYRFLNKGIADTIDNVYFPNYNHESIKTTQNNPTFAGSIMTPFQYNVIDGVDTNVHRLEYSMYGIRFGPLAMNGGVLYKKTIHQIFSTSTLDYIFICFKNIDTNVVVELANPIGSSIIFAKVYINKKLNNYDLDITNYEIIYDYKLLPNLNSLEVFFLDKDGYLINFNKLNVNLQMEVHEYVERIKSINTQNGQVM